MDELTAPGANLAFSQFSRRGINGRSIRTARYRFTVWETKDGALVARELYDLKDDPQGNVNRADQPDAQTQVLELTALLREKWPNNHDQREAFSHE
jgi:hypothetical protein